MTMTRQRREEESRRLIAEEIDATLVVEAAAGTGKTTELVNRILSVIERGRAEVREIVAVTFTEKAAGELKLRLRQRLEERRRDSADATAAMRLEHAVQHLEEAHVSTIHGFCADLLRERPVEARVDPLFRVLTEGQSKRLFDQAFDTWFQQQLEDPPEGVRRSLRRTGRVPRPGESEDGPIERLRRAAYELTQWRDFRTSWERPPFDRAGTIDRVVALVHALAEVSASPSYAADNLFLDTAPVRRASRDLRGTSADDLDGIEAQLVDLRRHREFTRARRGSGAGYGKQVSRVQVLEARGALMEALDDFRTRADADLAAALHGELLDCVDRYEVLKQREGALDFLDLLLRARNLVYGDASVRRHFQQRFKRIFVDEFQDTDPLQAELLLLLASADSDLTEWQEVIPSPGKLFLVGDPKQSIYRFRRADVSVYQRVCDHLVATGATRVELHRSFRAVPNLQQAVNTCFAPLMDGDVDGLQARYMALEPSRADYGEQPSLVALPVPRPYGHRYVAGREIELSLPDAVGAYIHWLVRESGWTVTERRDPERRVPLESRHICVLFRRFVSFGSDVTRGYVEALEARGVPHLLVGGRTFHEREEIETLRAALMAIEWPDDQLSVFATLKGALFAIGDAELLEFHHLAGRFHPFRIPAAVPDRLHAVVDALTLLAGLHRQRNRRPVADTIAALLDYTRAHVGFVLRPGGEQALANVLHVSELARQYELDGGMSFRGFVESLYEEAVGGHAAEAPILEEGSDGVRLMTVHKAKGLEFPVVVLADITARLTPWEAGRYIDPDRRLCAVRIGGWSPAELNDHQDLELRREQKEGERVAYVAATRARDLLVIPAVGDEPYTEGWVSPLNGAIYPPEGARRSAVASPGCPAFRSKDSVLNRPDGDPAGNRTMCPGTHTVGEGEQAHSVVWWSPEPGILTLDVEPLHGLRRDDLIVKEIAPEIIAEGQTAYRDWRNARDAAVARASVPSIRVRTATEVASEERATPLPDVEVSTLNGSQERPSGKRFGTLVHALLADMPLGPGGQTSVAKLASAYGRVFAATREEVHAAEQIAAQVLAHPHLLAAARAAEQGCCYRETPVTWRTEDGTVIEGVVDLAYETDAGVTVIDFKTDRADEERVARYRRQVAAYAAAIARATGRPAFPVLLNV